MYSKVGKAVCAKCQTWCSRKYEKGMRKSSWRKTFFPSNTPTQMCRYPLSRCIENVKKYVITYVLKQTSDVIILRYACNTLCFPLMRLTIAENHSWFWWWFSSNEYNLSVLYPNDLPWIWGRLVQRPSLIITKPIQPAMNRIELTFSTP